eukprot:TRINITY_DN13_c4_g1_i1.p1 TRINITY_DN13_c4_g1~~TRINITY_DN13_c4_g1_i1.p1  ORF type:complete len:276 (+),score=48.87 TRINITY_DN13_c4_g1_i1:132-959(+)
MENEIYLEHLSKEKEQLYVVLQELPIRLVEISKLTMKASNILSLSEKLISFNIPGKYQRNNKPIPRLDGVITLTSSSILDADISVNFGKIHHKTHITEMSPLLLRQILNSRNNLISSIERIKGLLELILRSPTGSDNLHTLSCELKEISQCINNSKQEILIKPPNTFPKNLLVPQTHFKPKLPKSIVVDIYLVNAKLKVAAYGLHFSQNRSQRKQIFGPTLVGSCYKINNNYIDVIDQEETEVEISFITEALELISEAYLIIINLRNKVNTILDA